MFVSISLVEYSYPSRRLEFGVFWISKGVSYEKINICLFSRMSKKWKKEITIKHLITIFSHNFEQIWLLTLSGFKVMF